MLISISLVKVASESEDSLSISHSISVALFILFTSEIMSLIDLTSISKNSKTLTSRAAAIFSSCSSLGLLLSVSYFFIVERLMPLFHGSYLTGFLGLDNPYLRENENFIFFLELIGAHLGSALVNTLVEQHLKQKNKELEHKNMFLDTL